MKSPKAIAILASLLSYTLCHRNTISYLDPTFDQSYSLMCKKELLEIFGMKGTKMSMPRLASPDEKSLCRRNQETCCDARNIMSVASYFSESVRNFKRKFEVVEELLTLFRGPKFLGLMDRIDTNGPCMNYTISMLTEIEGQQYYFPSETYMSVLLNKIEMLTEDLAVYIKNVIWFHGNLVCTICNPNYQKFFDIGHSYSRLGFNSNNCLETFEEKDFELRLMKLYNEFLVPVVKTLKCEFPKKIEEILSQEYFTLEEIIQIKKEKEKFKSYSNNGGFSKSNLLGSRGNDDRTYNGKFLNPRNKFDEILEIPPEKLMNFQNKVEICMKDLEVSNSICQDLCKKPILSEQGAHKGLYTSLQSILSILFYLLTGKTVESYYREYKDSLWNHGEFDDDLAFFEKNIYANKYKFNNLDWVFSAHTGLDLYSETISKKFLLHFEDSQSVLSFVVIALLAFFLCN